MCLVRNQQVQLHGFWPKCIRTATLLTPPPPQKKEEKKQQKEFEWLKSLWPFCWLLQNKQTWFFHHSNAMQCIGTPISLKMPTAIFGSRIIFWIFPSRELKDPLFNAEWYNKITDFVKVKPQLAFHNWISYFRKMNNQKKEKKERMNWKTCLNTWH